MTAPDYVAQAAEVIRQGIRDQTGDCVCGEAYTARALVDPHCGWHTAGGDDLPEETARALAAAGLIPTSTEWGVRFYGADEPMTYPDKADARRVAIGLDADVLVSRPAHDWKDATNDQPRGGRDREHATWTRTRLENR